MRGLNLVFLLLWQRILRIYTWEHVGNVESQALPQADGNKTDVTWSQGVCRSIKAAFSWKWYWGFPCTIKSKKFYLEHHLLGRSSLWSLQGREIVRKFCPGEYHIGEATWELVPSQIITFTLAIFDVGLAFKISVYFFMVFICMTCLSLLAIILTVSSQFWLFWRKYDHIFEAFLNNFSQLIPSVPHGPWH